MQPGTGHTSLGGEREVRPARPARHRGGRPGTPGSRDPAPKAGAWPRGPLRGPERGKPAPRLPSGGESRAAARHIAQKRVRQRGPPLAPGGRRPHCAQPLAPRRLHQLRPGEEQQRRYRGEGGRAAAAAPPAAARPAPAPPPGAAARLPSPPPTQSRAGRSAMDAAGCRLLRGPGRRRASPSVSPRR